MRRARVSVPGFPYHVTQRGNRRGDVFHDAEDRHLYLELLREYATHHRMLLWTYSLMSNHIHLIVLPETESAMSKALRDTHAAYASIFNRKYDVSGHLWQARFYSCVLDDAHLVHAVRYVECNPVRAGIVTRAEDYPWSSAGAHVFGVNDRYLDGGLPLVEEIQDWSSWLASGNHNDESNRAIRAATNTGRVCGSDEFIRRIEQHAGRRLRPRKRGRKGQSGINNDGDENCSLSLF